jgi:UbiD family decarboxylase
MAAFDTETYCKIVVVVDDDIEILDLVGAGDA